MQHAPRVTTVDASARVLYGAPIRWHDFRANVEDSKYALPDDRDRDGGRRKLGWDRGCFGGSGQWQGDCASSRSCKLRHRRSGWMWPRLAPRRLGQVRSMTSL